MEKIAKQVRSIKSYLVEGETISLQNIGELLLNTEGSVVFNPSYQINYLTDAFGLSHFNSQNITREAHKQKTEAMEVMAPIALTPEKPSNHWLKYAAAAVLVLGLSGMGAAKYFNDSVIEHNQIAESEAKQEIDNKIQEATFFISNPLPAAKFSLEKQNGNYHIVAGAFRVEANSDKKIEQLKSLGYKARKIGVNRFGLHEVVYSSYETRTEAQQELFKIRSSHNKDAWLLVKDLNK